MKLLLIQLTMFATFFGIFAINGKWWFIFIHLAIVFIVYGVTWFVKEVKNSWDD